MKFAGVTSKALAINTNELSVLQDSSGYSVAIYCNAVDELTNTLNDFELKVTFTGAMSGIAASLALSSLALSLV